jgi:hypothetical protein
MAAEARLQHTPFKNTFPEQKMCLIDFGGDDLAELFRIASVRDLDGCPLRIKKVKQKQS